MKKYFLFVILISNLLYANNNKYKIEYENIQVGEIDNFIKNIETQDYFSVKVTNTLAKWILRTDYVTFYMGEKPNINLKTKFKKDKKQIISILRQILKNKKTETITMNNGNKLEVECSINKCNYKYIEVDKNNRVKNYGSLTFDDNKNLLLFTEDSKDISIVKI